MAEFYSATVRLFDRFCGPVLLRDSHINTTGTHGRGIDAYMYSNDGDIDVYAENIDITSTGEQGHGIRTRLQKPTGGQVTGDILVDVQGGMITTKNAYAFGLYNKHEGDGILDIDVGNLDIKTESTGDYRGSGTLSHGIFGQHTGDGDIDIDVQGGSIMTAGSYSYGIYGTHSGAGNITVGTRDGHTITTTGDNAHGIVAYHYGTEDSRTIDITVGGSVDASGAGAQGVRVGVVNADGDPERVTGLDEEGYRRQTVTVDGRVSGGSSDGAGIFLAGGGKVFIGPLGTVGAHSGIAILASGGTPKLYVAMDLDGRRVAEVIGDDWIVNDGGETTIVVNDVLLHDGATGVVPAASAPNGAFDVTIRDDGLTVDTGTDPWTVSERSTSTITDRDFAAEDFVKPAPPPMCPEGQTGTPPNCETPPPPMCPEGQTGTPPDCVTRPIFMEEYAPRAALYETLPDLLQRLSPGGGGGGGGGGETSQHVTPPFGCECRVARGRSSRNARQWAQPTT